MDFKHRSSHKNRKYDSDSSCSSDSETWSDYYKTKDKKHKKYSKKSSKKCDDKKCDDKKCDDRKCDDNKYDECSGF